MATDYKISELASATSLDGTEQLVVVKDGENRKISTNTIKDLTGFTTNDFTNAEKTKLAGIAEGADVTPTLGAVATSNSYNDLDDKPTIPSISGLATETYVDNAISDLATEDYVASAINSAINDSWEGEY